MSTTNGFTAVTDGLSGVTGQIATAVAAIVGIALVPWGAKFAWGKFRSNVK